MARPRKIVDEKLVEKLASIGCTLPEIAELSGCGLSTLKRRFGPVIEKGRASLKMSIRRAQYVAAVKNRNVTMLIWLGKIILGQKDNSAATLQIDNASVKMPEDIASAMDSSIPPEPPPEEKDDGGKK